jgi:hypothetical protein
MQVSVADFSNFDGQSIGFYSDGEDLRVELHDGKNKSTIIIPEQHWESMFHALDDRRNRKLFGDLY